MRIISPAELLERSDVVIIGRVLSVEPTGKSGKIQLGKNPQLPVAFHCGKIEPVAIIKGEDLPEMITLTYSSVDNDKLNPPILVNGPHRIWLEKDRLFLFYLKKAGGAEAAFVGALDGDFDDGRAVIRLPDTSAVDE